MSKQNFQKDYDEYGKYIRDYENMEIPFDELALPRTEEESKLFLERFKKEGKMQSLLELAQTPIEERGFEAQKSHYEILNESYDDFEEEIINDKNNNLN